MLFKVLLHLYLVTKGMKVGQILRTVWRAYIPIMLLKAVLDSLEGYLPAFIASIMMCSMVKSRSCRTKSATLPSGI